MNQEEKLPRLFVCWIGIGIGIFLVIMLNNLGYYGLIGKLISWWCYGSFILLFVYAIVLILIDKLKGGKNKWMKKIKTLNKKQLKSQVG